MHSFKWIATAERIEAQINPHSMKKQIYALGGGLTFLFVLAAIVAGLAQTTRVVTGVVSDGQGDPLPGVTVLLKDTGSQGGTTTDASGRFSLSVPEDGGTLIFSFIGKATREVAIPFSGEVNVVLEDDTQTLDEVVVVGYGTQRRANLTGSVVSVDTDDLTTRPFTTTSTALQGVTPGVTVTRSSGQPGATGTIRVRGIGTLNDSNPLILIDGVEGDFNIVDPSMIESITVLKDAASSAIYGSRAANGVILITTKRAKGNTLQVSYNAYAGFQEAMNLPKKVNAIDHMEMINLAHINSGAAPLYDDAFIEAYRQNMHSDPDNYPNTDWQKEVLTGSGFLQNHNLSINSGADKFRFLTSVGYLDQKGLIEASNFRRYTFRNNADIKFNDKLSLQFDVQAIKTETVEPGSGTESVFLQMNRIPAVQPGRYSNGLYGEAWNGNNPIAFSTFLGGSQEEEKMNLLGRVVLKYAPVKWLEMELLAQPRYAELYNDNYERAITTYSADGSPIFTRPEKSTLANRSIRSMYGNYYGYARASKQIGRHDMKLMVGSSVETLYTRNFRAFRDNFIFPDYRVISAGAQDNDEATGTASEWALQSFFGRFNYDYESRYLIEVNARYDGSSRFARGYKYGFFPSVSAGWRISSERFMSEVEQTIGNLMLRASWGRLGNQNIGTYPFASTLSLGAYSMGGDIVPIAALNQMANTSISWETSEMTNIGLDLLLFDRVTVNVDWYDKITSDILLDLDIPMTIGLAAPTQNAGKVRNRGWELAVGYKGHSGDFSYSVDLNVADVRNTVLDLKGVNETGLLVSREGYPINSIYALQADGYFQSDEEVTAHVQQIGVLAPGDIRYIDQNDDDLINADDRVVVGSTIPRYTYGANLNASFRNFTFNAFIQGVGKADGYLYGRAIQPFFSGASAYESHKDYWTSDNRDAAFPRLTWGDAGNNYQHSSFWMKSAAYVRLKNIQIGYNLPESFLNTLKIRQARLYVNGQNLLTFDKFWDGFDVETPVGTGTNYPLVKVYTLGIDVRF